MHPDAKTRGQLNSTSKSKRHFRRMRAHVDILFFGRQARLKNQAAACSESAGHAFNGVPTRDFGMLFSDSKPGVKTKAADDDVEEEAGVYSPSESLVEISG
jgi:hypothetical protein